MRDSWTTRRTGAGAARERGHRVRLPMLRASGPLRAGRPRSQGRRDPLVCSVPPRSGDARALRGGTRAELTDHHGTVLLRPVQPGTGSGCSCPASIQDLLIAPGRDIPALAVAGKADLFSTCNRMKSISYARRKRLDLKLPPIEEALCDQVAMRPPFSVTPENEFAVPWRVARREQSQAAGSNLARIWVIKLGMPGCHKSPASGGFQT